MADTGTAMSNNNQAEKTSESAAYLPMLDPEVEIHAMWADIELLRAEVGLAPATLQQASILRDLSPFGR